MNQKTNNEQDSNTISDISSTDKPEQSNWNEPLIETPHRENTNNTEKTQTQKQKKIRKYKENYEWKKTTLPN